MKFLCDRCKTRYSIGEDRVRGKILKIRCKNCSNVITVREGMAEPSAADAAAESQRRSKPTTLAPIGSPVAPPPSSGKAGAPAALTEEWYVSIDGDQQGPFTLVDAQRWIQTKALDADLHCWSEGFDDWLPVDKVSHFRGIRQRASQPPAPPPRPSAPPPVPRGAVAYAQGSPARGDGGMTAGSGAEGRRGSIDESEPKPLFAATMASIEKASGPVAAPSMPSALAGSGPAPQTTKPAAVPAPSTVSNGSGAVPAFGRAPNLSGTGPQRIGTSPGIGAQPFEGATEIEEPPFNDEASTTAEPVAAAKRNGLNGTGPNGKVADPFAAKPKADPFAPKTIDPFAPRPVDPFAAKPAHDPFASGHHGPTMPSPPPAIPNPTSVTDSDEDDGLNIGEVSRVVNLADLMRQGPSRKDSQPNRRAVTAPAVLQTRTGSMPRIGSGPIANLGGTGPAAAIPGAAIAGYGDPNAPVESGADPHAEPLAPMAPVVQRSHRRGMIALLVGAAALLGAAIVVVVLVTAKSEVNYGDRLSGGGTDIDTTRPDDPIRKIQQQLGSGGSAAGLPEVPDPTKPIKRNTGGNTGGNTTVQNPVLPSNSLKAEEIEAMAARNSGVTQRCWIRAQRGETGLLIADIKKINVTLAVDATGKVNDVTLSQASDNALGKCLITAVKTWSFRANSGGTFKFSMVFTGS